MLSHDETAIYTLSAEGQFSSWSMYQSGQRFFEHDLRRHDEAFFRSRRATRAWGQQFALSGDNKHVLTCSSHGGVIYDLGGSNGSNGGDGDVRDGRAEDGRGSRARQKTFFSLIASNGYLLRNT